MSTIHSRTTVDDLIKMEITIQPRLILRQDADPTTQKLNECVHCQNDGKHVASNFAVTYAELEVTPNKQGKPWLKVRRYAIHEEVCDSHLPDVMENVRDYYDSVLHEYETATSVEEVMAELNARPTWSGERSATADEIDHWN